jgi:hypothetical protein
MYLVSYSPFPFTAGDIRPAIGLVSRDFDGIIESAIASMCIGAQKQVREEVWAIADGTEPFAIASHVGPLYQMPDHADRRWFRDHTFPARPEALEVVRQRIVKWCLNQADIHRAIMAEQRARDEAAGRSVEGEQSEDHHIERAA